MTDPYRILGVDAWAKEADIKAAFRRKAREFHPDRNDAPDALQRMKEINAAYQVLSDPDARVLWDEFGEESLRVGFNPVAARRRRDAELFRPAWAETKWESRVPSPSTAAPPPTPQTQDVRVYDDTPWWVGSAEERTQAGPCGSFGAFGPSGPGSRGW